MVKNKKLKAKIQAFQNELNSSNNTFSKKEFKKNDQEVDFSQYIKKDLKITLILIAISFGILFLIKYLDSNLFFNKFF